MPEYPVTILGGLPVIADCSFGVDDGPNGRDYWADVNALYWIKANGKKGKEVTQAIYDKLEKRDQYWQADVTEQVSEGLAWEAYNAKENERTELQT